MKLRDFFKTETDGGAEKHSRFPKFGGYVSRTAFFSLFGAVFTLIFAIFNGIFGILIKSLWFGAFAGYYLVLSFQRISVLISYEYIGKKYADNAQKTNRAKQKIYLANGAVFIPLTIALTVIVPMLVNSARPAAYGEIAAITTATYAFYKITAAAINLRKAAKTKDAVAQTLRNIGFVDALTSIMLLENTLISTFGELDSGMKSIIALSGLFVCAFNIALGSFMVITAAKRLRQND